MLIEILCAPEASSGLRLALGSEALLEYLCAYKALIVLLALAGAALNAAGKWQGFLFWMVTNLYWCLYNYAAGEYEQVVIFATFELLCVWGIYRWARHTGVGNGSQPGGIRGGDGARICVRCGKCCVHLGSGWFRQSKHPLIKRMAELTYVLEGAAGQYLPDGPEELGCCAVYDEENKLCLIHKYLGFDAKPEVCRDHPEDEPCVGSRSKR